MGQAASRRGADLNEVHAIEARWLQNTRRGVALCSYEDEREFVRAHPLGLALIMIPTLAVATLAIGLDLAGVVGGIYRLVDRDGNPMGDPGAWLWLLSALMALGLFFLLVFVARRNNMALLGWLQVHRHVRGLLWVTVGWPVLLLAGWILWSG